MMMQKLMNAIFSMPPRYRALKNAKAENILKIFFNAGIGK
jgi:hypothetical protein